jgi:anti-sigma-K factor RskA
MAEHARTLQAQNNQIAMQDSLLGQLVAGNSERYTMHAVQPGSSAVAQVAWLDQDNTAVLRAEGFPPLQEGQAYQLWLIRGDTRTSGGLFTVDDTGCGTYIFHPAQSLDDFDGMGITPEPATGSPGPTAPPVVRAQL